MRWPWLALPLLACAPPPATAPAPATPATASSGDPALAPWVRVIEGYVMDAEPPGEGHDQLLEAIETLGERPGAVRADPAASKALFDLFEATHFTWPKARRRKLYRRLSLALQRVAAPAWEARLLALVEVPIASLRREEAPATFDRLYWHVTAIPLLGALQSEAAIDPLLRLILSPFQEPTVNDAVLALLQIGPPALEEALRFLAGERDDLEAYAVAEYRRFAADRGQAPHDELARFVARETAVTLVANFSHEACVQPLVSLATEGRPADAAFAASSLHLVPQGPAVTEAFLAAYDRFGWDDELPGEGAPKALLLGVAAAFYDDAVTDHLLAAGAAPGADPETRARAAAALLDALVPVARARHWEQLEALVELLPRDELSGARLRVTTPAGSEVLTDRTVAERVEEGTLREAELRPEGQTEAAPQSLGEALPGTTRRARYREALRQGRALLDECGDERACYLTRAADLGTPPVVADKGVAMAGVLEGAPSGATLVQALLEEPGRDPILGAFSQLLLASSPEGAPEAVARFEAACAGPPFVDDERGKRCGLVHQVVARLRFRQRTLTPPD